MKRKIFNLFITMLAVAGVVIFVGAVGMCDYTVEVGKHYPLLQTIMLMVVSGILCLPAIIREVC